MTDKPPEPESMPSVIKARKPRGVKGERALERIKRKQPLIKANRRCHAPTCVQSRHPVGSSSLAKSAGAIYVAKRRYTTRYWRRVARPT